MKEKNITRIEEIQNFSVSKKLNEILEYTPIQVFVGVIIENTSLK